MKRGPQVPPVVAILIIALALGGVGGYYFHFFRAKPVVRPSSAPAKSQGILAPVKSTKGFAPTFDQAITYLWRTEKDHHSTCSDFQVEQFLSVFKMMRSSGGNRGYQETTTLTLFQDNQLEEMRKMFGQKGDQTPPGKKAEKEPDVEAMIDDLIKWFEARREAS